MKSLLLLPLLLGYSIQAEEGNGTRDFIECMFEVSEKVTPMYNYAEATKDSNPFDSKFIFEMAELEYKEGEEECLIKFGDN